MGGRPSSAIAIEMDGASLAFIMNKFYHLKDQDEKDATLQENEVKFALRTAQKVSQAYKPIARGEHIPQGERYKWIEEHTNQVMILFSNMFFVMRKMSSILTYYTQIKAKMPKKKKAV